MAKEGKTLRIETASIFLPLLESKRYKGAFGGRGSGKSTFFAGAIVERFIQYPGTRAVCIREVQKSLRESVKLLIEDTITKFGADGLFRSLSDSIQGPGGGIILFQGMADHTAESIKSLEGFDIAYCEEAQTLTERSLEFLRPTIRKDEKNGWPASELWFAWNPRHSSDPVDKFFRGDHPPKNSILVRTNWDQNPFFPLASEEDRQYDLMHFPDRYRHIWEGEYEPAAVGAIWDRQTISDHRVKESPPMKRIVVAVDPSLSTGGDEVGIIVCGHGDDGRGYVLGDYSLKGSPEQWASAAVAAYDLHEADAIVAEVNAGGDMVESTIHAVRKVRVIKIHASRGKHVRAEPISALYKLDRISHVGAFPVLEQQMCQVTATGYEGEGSPDRVDALVHAFTELFPQLTKKVDRKPQPTRQNNHYNPHRLYG